MVMDFYGKLSRVEDSVRDTLPEGYDVDEVCKHLEVAFCEEILAGYQYAVVAPFIAGAERANIEDAFGDIAKDEIEDHAVSLLGRMNELSYTPTTAFDFSKIQETARCEYAVPGDPSDIRKLLEQNLASEECAIRTYQELCDLTRGKDYGTYTLVKRLLVEEQEHATTLQDFINDYDAIKDAE